MELVPPISRPPVLCDLDGVVWLSRVPIPGSVAAVAALRAAGHRVLFVTNNSAPTLAEQEAALAAVGIPAEGDVLTSSLAAAQLIEPGARVFVCGGPGIAEAVERRGAEVVTAAEKADAVIVGITRAFDYELLDQTSAAARRGALLVGTNDDATYPTPGGPIPGGGAILAAVSVACGVLPVIAGKPHAPMADLVRAVVGADAAAEAVMVGDRPETDGLFARRLGCRFALVDSGVTAAGAVVEPSPDLRGANLLEIAERLLAEHEPPDSRRGRDSTLTT